uniref:HAT C-terminal dimerisation domain-containing protein n=1 Tax=Amphimedon queenslandica TaxID=400682 RepID=A0A1X7TU47_AMPQE
MYGVRIEESDLKIAMTVAVTSAENKRSFLTLKRIKTRLRSTMGQERLSALAILSIEGEIAKELDYGTILDTLASPDKNRQTVIGVLGGSLSSVAIFQSQLLRIPHARNCTALSLDV